MSAPHDSGGGLLAGSVVVVSGVGPGLGRSIALRCARNGADLVLAARTESKLDEVAEQVRGLGRRALTVPTDITDADSAATLRDAAVAEYGRVDTAEHGSLCPLSWCSAHRIRF